MAQEPEVSLLPCKDEFIMLPRKDTSDERGAWQPVLPLKCPAESLRETHLAKCRMGTKFSEKTGCYIESFPPPPPPQLGPKELSMRPP